MMGWGQAGAANDRLGDLGPADRDVLLDATVAIEVAVPLEVRQQDRGDEGDEG